MCNRRSWSFGGEARSVPQIEQRIAQARRRGYKKIVVPITQQDSGGPCCIGVASIGDLEGFVGKNAVCGTSEARLSDGEKVGIA